MELCPKCNRMTAERCHYSNKLKCYAKDCVYDERDGEKKGMLPEKTRTEILENRSTPCVKDPSFECEGPVPQICKGPIPMKIEITKEEETIFLNLVNAWNTFSAMERQHPDELDEFRHSIHDLQRIVSMRILRRMMPGQFYNKGEKG